MNSIFLVALFAAIVPFNLFSAEPSAFGAGNLTDSKPYGLTSSEEVILQNKKNLRKVFVKSNNQANEVDSIRERIDGLQSIIEGISQKAQENRLNLKKLDQKNAQELISTNEYERRLSEITGVNSQDIAEIKLSIEELFRLNTKLSELLNTVNTSYVSRDEYNTLVNDFNLFKDLVVKELKKNAASTRSPLERMSNAEIAKIAKKSYDSKKYKKSLEYYSHLIEKKYKPARAHYMVGEIKYKRKEYSDAIAYFKKSASLYSKANYMSILMLHTARSMQLTGDKNNAISFYKAVIAKYPKSKSAKEAKKKLSKMK